MIKVLIIEDETLAAKRLESLILKYNRSIVILDKLPSIQSSLKWFQQSTEQPDLIFMDIHLEDGLSFSIIEQLKLQYPIIFTTAFDEYIIKAFKVNSVDYLLKPINDADLATGINKFFELRSRFQAPSINLRIMISDILNPLENYKNRFLVNEGNVMLTIEVHDIAYFFAEDRFTILVSKKGKQHIVEYTLDKLMQILNPKIFFRINRQFIVHTESIESMVKYSANKLKLILRPATKKEVFVSMEKYRDFKTWLDS
jgi:DNA-binding LytR/AlgR family response regulator